MLSRILSFSFLVLLSLSVFAGGTEYLATKESGERFLVKIDYSEHGYTVHGDEEVIETFEKGKHGYSFISSIEGEEMAVVLLSSNRWPRTVGTYVSRVLTGNNEHGTHTITFLGFSERGREYREERRMAGILKYRTFTIVDENDRHIFYSKVWADGRSMKFSKRIVTTRLKRP